MKCTMAFLAQGSDAQLTESWDFGERTVSVVSSSNATTLHSDFLWGTVTWRIDN